MSYAIFRRYREHFSFAWQLKLVFECVPIEAIFLLGAYESRSLVVGIFVSGSGGQWH